MNKRLFLFLILLAFAQAPAIASTPFSTRPFRLLLNLLESLPVPGGSDWPLEEMPMSPAPEDLSIAFSADLMGEGALLKWDLPRPAEVASLIIEGSADGSHFIDLESLENTEAGVLDVFYDATPQGRRFYRLVANYKDGVQKTTAVNTLPLSVAFSAAIDPEQDGVLIVTGRASVELYDLQGQLITSAHPVEGKCEIELHGLTHGPYLVRAGDRRQVVVY